MLLNKLICLIVVLLIHIGLANLTLDAGMTGSSQNTITQSTDNAPGNDHVTINNNLFWQNTNNFSGITYDTVTNPGNCLFENPHLDANLVPIWSDTIMSPCIDSGNPDTDGDGIAWNGDGVNFDQDPDDVDADGTRLDIGSEPAIEHIQQEYTMPLGNKIKWMSFPVLNRVTNGYTTNENFFAPILNYNVLDWVDWKEGASEKYTMSYTPDGLENGDQETSSIWGYKILLKPSVMNQIELDVPGFIEAPNTVMQLYKNENRSATTPNENWIGYFQPKSSHPFDAFANILGYVTSIRSQYWSMARLPQTGVWLMTPGVPVINHGDMVIVTVSQDCSFTWNNSQPTDPRLRLAPVRFEYTEKPDYTPLYLYLDTLEELPSEIGVYVDGVCKGAVKVEGDFTDVCVYLDADETLNPDNCEIVLYFEAKGSPEVRKSYKPKADDILQVSDSGVNFYTMKLKNDTELSIVVPVTALQQNYPNPFNPSTTISYELAVDGPVILEIYNIKGQKIKTLVNGSKVSGSHKVIWDGTDKYGRAVASGLYNYRLITKDETISKKMLLVK